MIYPKAADVLTAPLGHGASHAPGGSDDLYGGFGHRLSTCVEPFPAWLFATNSGVTSGSVYFMFFTADSAAGPLSKMEYDSRGVVSSGLTLARMGIYSISGTTLTLAARTASDTTIGNNSNAKSQANFATAGGYPATYSLVRGTQYAFAFILVGTPGNAPSAGGGMTTDMAARGPLCRRYDSQADLPTSVDLSSLSQSTALFYIAALT